jgi:cellulose synthase (UDP-forming)
LNVKGAGGNRNPDKSSAGKGGTQKSLNHRLFSGEVELEAARRGEYVGDTYNDRPSSLQQADELSIRIAEAEAELTSRDQRLAKLRAELDAEAAHYSELSTAVLTSPIDAQVWEVLVSPGEEVRKGQDLLRLLDCSGAVVTVTVRESVFNQLRIGDKALFRFSSQSGGHDGTIVRMSGVAAPPDNLAIQPSGLSSGGYRIAVSGPRPRVDTVRSRPHRNGRIQRFSWVHGDAATASRRDFLFYARFLTLMSGGWSEPIAPALVAVGLLCLFLPWADRENRWVRAALVAVSLILTWYYLLWRITQTLPQFGLSADWLCGIIFLGAEVLTGIGATITWFMLTRSSSRSATVAANTPWLVQTRPLVDVLICTYNEDRAILERTIIGAMAMSYPNSRVWVLDDGRRAWLSDLCSQRGCRYLTRPDNSHAKAGNINHALLHLAQLPSPPDFIAILDADFVPFRNFVSRALCLFKEPSVGIVQTPQHFFNPDPIQNNLAISEVFPDEQRFFFDIIMPSKDAWDLAFCCGTSSVIRFSALREIGGFPTDSVTEDFLLTVRLRELGYKTVYLNEKLSVGLAPEGLREYATQRTRWCLGLVQICRGRSGPFRLRNGLPLAFRISLIETFLYWGASFAFRILCQLAPAMYFLFNIRIVHASLADAIAHFAPMVIMQVAITTWLGGGRMLPLIADVYQLLIAPEIITVVAFTLLRPGGHKFKVTAKGIQHAGLNVQWGLLFRFLLMASVIILGLAKVFAFDNSDMIEDGGALNLFWAWYNLVVLTICCWYALSSLDVDSMSDSPPRKRCSLRSGIKGMSTT